MTTHGPIDPQEISLPKAEAFAADPYGTVKFSTDLQQIADDSRDNVRRIVRDRWKRRELAHAAAYGTLVGRIRISDDVREIRAALTGTEQALTELFR